MYSNSISAKNRVNITIQQNTGPTSNLELTCYNKMRLILKSKLCINNKLLIYLGKVYILCRLTASKSDWTKPTQIQASLAFKLIYLHLITCALLYYIETIH